MIVLLSGLSTAMAEHHYKLLFCLKKKPSLNSISHSVRLWRIDRRNAGCRAGCAIGWSLNSKSFLSTAILIALVAHMPFELLHWASSFGQAENCSDWGKSSAESFTKFSGWYAGSRGVASHLCNDYCKDCHIHMQGHGELHTYIPTTWQTRSNRSRLQGGKLVSQLSVSSPIIVTYELPPNIHPSIQKKKMNNK